MKHILWALFICAFAASASAHYKLLFSRAAVELYLQNDTYVAHALRADAFNAPDHILTTGCEPSKVQTGALTSFDCFGDIMDSDDGRYRFVVSPPVRVGDLPDVRTARMVVVDHFSLFK
jgi:hypothetical protein